MIVGSFYPSIIPPGTTYLTQFTDLIGNITVQDPNKIAEPYYMGYIPYDQLPSTYKISKQDVTDGVITLSDVTNQENVPWFYTGKYNTNQYNRYPQGVYKLNTATNKFESISTGVGGVGTYGFINSAEIATLTTSGYFTIHFTCQMSESDGTYIDWWNDVNNAWHHFNLTVAEFLGFMAGTYAIHFSFNQYDTTGTFDMHYNDLKEGTYTYTDPVSGRKMRIFITAFSTPDTFVDYDSEGSQRYFSDICAASLLHVNHEDGVLPYIINYNAWHYGYADANYLSVSVSGNNITIGNRLQLYSNYLCGGWNGTIPREFWANPNGETAVFGNMVAINHHTNLDGRLYRLFTPDDIWRSFVSMFTRIFTAGNIGYGYSTGRYWALFNEDNSPKWEFSDGDFNTIVTKLRPWQISNITNNDFAPSDIPDYGDEDDIRGTGFWHLNNTVPYGSATGFITQYAITGSQLLNFGHYLWAAFSDQQFWDSICVAFTEALSFNPSDILNYIVSIRQFPFTVPATSSVSKIYIGRGTLGINIGSNVYVVDNLCISKASNWIHIPKHYSDFRDYESVTSVNMFVPFCGVVELTPSQVVDSYVRLVYNIDLQTGECQAAIQCKYTENGDDFIIATINGQMGATIQMSASNLSQVLQKGASFAVGVAATIATAGVAMEASYASLEEGITATEAAEYESESIKATGKTANTALSTVSSITGISPAKFAQTSGFCNMQVTIPNIQVTRRHYVVPSNYGHVYGYACNMVMKLEDLAGKGFTVCRNVDLTGVPATQEELAVLEQLLQTGVYL